MAEEEALDRRRVVALDLHAVVRDRATAAPERRLQQAEELVFVPADVRDDRRRLPARTLLRRDGHPALLRAAHLERHGARTHEQERRDRIARTDHREGAGEV